MAGHTPFGRRHLSLPPSALYIGLRQNPSGWLLQVQANLHVVIYILSHEGSTFYVYLHNFAVLCAYLKLPSMRSAKIRGCKNEKITGAAWEFNCAQASIEKW